MLPLTERQIEIHFAVVELFNRTGEPVGSAAVSRLERIQVSSATVRNVMADLEEQGLLFQPHTSAGRVPTSEGMRFYVDFLIESGRLGGGAEPGWGDHFERLVDNDVETMVRSAGLVISQIAKLTSIVSSPRVSAIRLKELHLAWVSESRVLVILITEDGRVFNRVVRLDQPLDPAALVRMQNYLSELVVGLSLDEVRRKVRAQLRSAESQYRQFVRRALEISQEALEVATRSELFVEGTLHMLEFAELAMDIQRVRDVLGGLEDRERVLGVLDGICDSLKVQTLIGSELGGDWGADLSLIACGYSKDGLQAGMVGVIGPIRMNYARLIPLVEHTARVLSKELEDLA